MARLGKNYKHKSVVKCRFLPKSEVLAAEVLQELADL